MGIWLSWKLILVASILCLRTSLLASSESLDPLNDPTYTRENKPPIKISSVQFESLCINIYDSQTTKNNKKIYFYSPLALLNHKNVALISNNQTHGTLSVGFQIWKTEVRTKVAEHLNQSLSQQIELSQVKVFPFDSVRLTSKVQSADFSLTNEWLPYNNNQQILRFALICPTREDCGRVKNEMYNRPEQFDHLQLEFNPKLNDDDCFNDGVGISEENGLPMIQVKELLAKLEAKLQKKLETTEKKLEATETLLTSIWHELSNTVDDLTSKFNAQTSELMDIGRMPTSCDDLQRTGHKLSGFFSVRGSKKMEMIYCNFYANQNDKQKWIGYADVKSAPVHFYVQRTSTFFAQGTPVPFELAVVNEGNAMNLTSGKFTAPRPGIYFFSFAGVARLALSSPNVDFYCHLHLNGNSIGSSHVYEGTGPVLQMSSLTLQSTLNLKTGDQLWLTIQYTGDSYLYDSDKGVHYTHFTGFMLEEEIVESL